MLSGTRLEELRAQGVQHRSTMIARAGCFVLGFSVIFLLAGLAAGSAGRLLSLDRPLIGRIGGGLVLLFGLQMLGLWPLPALHRVYRLPISFGGLSAGIAFVSGVAFAAGWSPCIGPLLASVLVLAGTHPGVSSMALLCAYTLGFAVPFLLTALLIDPALRLLAHLKPWLHWSERIAGLLLSLIGLCLLFYGALPSL